MKMRRRISKLVKNHIMPIVAWELQGSILYQGALQSTVNPEIKAQKGSQGEAVKEVDSAVNTAPCCFGHWL